MLHACMLADVVDRVSGQQRLNQKVHCSGTPALRPSWHQRQLRLQSSTASAIVTKAHTGATETEQSSSLSRRYNVPTTIVNRDIEGLLNQELDGRLIVRPEYQRGFVWKEPKCSRLIETVLSGLPIQEIWLHEQPSGTKEVIDGQQRLTTIKAFRQGTLPNSQPFKLQGLEDLVELNGKGFQDLARADQRSFMAYDMCCCVVLPIAEPAGVFEVYQRMNTGSENLNAQQIRRAAYRGPYIKMLDMLAQTHMSQLKGPKNAFTKDEDRELILRFFALSNSLKKFKTPLYKFLNAEIQQNQHFSGDTERMYSGHFRKAFELAVSIYGIEVFRRWDGRKYHGAAVDTNLWDTVMLTLQNYSRAQLQPFADALQAELLKVKADPNFLSQPRLSRPVIEARVRKLQTSIENIRGLDKSGHGAQNRLFAPDMKKALFEQNPECAICEQKILQIADAHVDHIVPYAEGGKTELENAQLLHSICNRKKSNKLT